jgi:hypothetical protein
MTSGSAETVPWTIGEQLGASPSIAVTIIRQEPITTGTGAASGAITRLGLVIRPAGQAPREVTVIRKTLRRLSEGPHAGGVADPRHWAYGRREAEAYRSGLLPSGPGLRSPRCLGVVDDDIYLENVTGPMAQVDQAAGDLARWQTAFDPMADRPWMATDQLGRRLAVSHLDWSSIDADSRVVELWERRSEWMEQIRRVPVVRSHGDYTLGNLLSVGEDTVALDWATFGWEPLGFDLAHLALSSGADPTFAYLAAQRNASPVSLATGFRACLAVIGSSRVHWMLSRGMSLPTWYADFLMEHHPANRSGA